MRPTHIAIPSATVVAVAVVLLHNVVVVIAVFSMVFSELFSWSTDFPSKRLCASARARTASECRWRRSINVYTNFFASSIYLCLSLFVLFPWLYLNIEFEEKKNVILFDFTTGEQQRVRQNTIVHLHSGHSSSIHFNSIFSRLVHMSDDDDNDRHTQTCTMHFIRRKFVNEIKTKQKLYSIMYAMKEQRRIRTKRWGRKRRAGRAEKWKWKQIHTLIDSEQCINNNDNYNVHNAYTQSSKTTSSSSTTATSTRSWKLS